MKKALLAIGMAIALAAAVAGCGGGDDSTGSSGDSSSAALTKPEFIKQADAICKTGEEDLEAEANEFAEENDVDTENPTSEQQEEVVTDVVAPALHKQGEEIGELGAPEGDEETVEAMVEALESAADEVESDPTLLTESDENPFAEASKLAREYGLVECGEEG